MTENFACSLPSRGVIRLSGEDRRPFLQGLISNDIDACTPQNPIYAALLTPQGKFLHDMFILDQGESFLIDCEAHRAGDLERRLKTFKLRSKITLENQTDAFEVWVRSERPRPDETGWYLDPRLPTLGARALFKKGSPHPVLQIQDAKTYDKHRLEAGVPDGSRDMIVEKSTLLECNLDWLGGISWTKGCYMGQELTARMHYRGLVKKRLFPVVSESEAPPAQSILQMNGEDCGEMRSHCGDLGLALLNIDQVQKALQEGLSLKSGDHHVKPFQPAWMKN